MQIQQDPSSELASTMRARCLGSRVAQLQRRVGRLFDQALAPHGVTMAQLELLAALRSVDGPVAPSALAGALSLERSTISRNLALLEDRDLVAVAERTPAGRARTVTLTDTGRSRLAESATAWSAAQSAAEAALGVDAPGALDGWLTALHADA